MNSIILACLALAGAVAFADAGRKKWKSKCVDREFPMCALAYKKQLTQPKQPGPTRLFDCAKCQAEATALQLTNPSVWIPVCNKDDSFKRKQYDPSTNESFCVDPYGEEDPKSRKKGKIVNCKIKAPAPKKVVLTDCLAMKAKAKKQKATYVPKCNKAGQFLHTQCYGKSRFCWCAMENGKPVPYTFFKRGRRRQPNCVQHRATQLNCKGKEGVRQHPFDCRRYLQCGKDTVYSCICPWGQAFNFSLKVCDWIENIKGCPRRGRVRKIKPVKPKTKIKPVKPKTKIKPVKPKTKTPKKLKKKTPKKKESKKKKPKKPKKKTPKKKKPKKKATKKPKKKNPKKTAG